MEKLKLFSREQVGNAPLTGRQYSRPDSLSLVSRQSVLAFLLVLLTTVFGVGNAWAAEELKATIDFASNDFEIPTSKTTAENTYTYDGISMTLVGTSGNGYAYYSKDKYLLNGKQGATITFSAFTWKTTKIVVTGRSGASGSTKMNIFVGEEAASTETTGSTGTNTYNIAADKQAAGTIYTLKVTSAHNAQFTKFEIYGETESGDDPGSGKTDVSDEQLAWSAASAEVTKDADNNEFPSLTNTLELNVTYQSTDEAVATISSTGEITLVKAGTTTIKATFAGDETYNSKTVSYTLTVNPAPLTPIAGTLIDELTPTLIGVTGTSYSAWTGKTATSEAVYAGKTANGNSAIQFNTIGSNNAGREIVTTTSGGTVKRIQVKWNTNTNGTGRTLKVYGSNDAYTGSETATSGTEIASFTYSSGNEDVYQDIDENYNFAYIQMVITGGAAYIDQINISWLPAPKYAVTIETPTNGSLTIKNGDDEITSGAEFKEGTELTVETEPANGYLLDVLKAYKTGDENTEVTITEGAFEMPAYGVTVVATFKENEAPAATLTLSENGTETPFPGSHKQGDVVTLPSTSSADCSKVLVGWDANENCAEAPTYAKGAEFTLSATSQKLYAVYAKATPGAVTNHAVDFENEASSYTEWTFTNISSGATDSGVTAHGGSKFGVTDGKATASIQTVSPVANPSSLTVHVSKKSTNTTTSTWKIQVSENGSSWTDVSSANGASMDKGKWVELSGDLSSYKNVYVRVYYDGSTAVRCIDDLVLAEQGAPTYSGYSTTCVAPLATPTFSVEAGEYNEAKSIELSAAEGTIYYTLDGSNPTSVSTEYNVAIPLDKCGTTTIKAIAISADNESAVAEATYTIAIPIPANSQASPYTPAQAIEVIDGGCYDGETIIYVKGVVKTSSGLHATYLNYDNVVVVAAETTSPEFTFYRLQKTAEDKFETTDPAIVEGDTIIAAGKLLKHTSGTYELAQGCYLVERKEFKAQKEAIESSLEAPLSVAQAIGYIDNGITYDLSQEVYVKAVADAAPNKYGTFTGHDADIENAFQFYDADLGDFTIGANDTVIVKGIIKLVNTNYRMESGVVQSVKTYVEPPVAVTGVTLATTAKVTVGKTVQLTATVAPEDATNKNVTWLVTSGNEYASVDENGVVTGIKAGEAVITVETEDGEFTATCTVTVEAISKWATTYTSNVEFAGGSGYTEDGSKVVIATKEYPAQKVGSSSQTGTITVTVPAYTHTLHFHVFTWKNQSMTMSVSSEDVTNLSATEISVNGDDAGGGSKTYTFTANSNPVDHYQYITFTPVAKEATITFSHKGGDNRIIMYGINQEGGVLPVLDHIVITGNASALNYEVGDAFNPAGLGVDAYYTLAGEPIAEPTHLDVDENWSGWSFNPAYLTSETTSVTVTATYEGKQASTTVENIEVTAPTTPEIVVNPSAVAFGTVNQNAEVAAEEISVTLKNVDAATVALTGDAEAFSIDKSALSGINSTITVTPVTSVAGTFAATLTISDNANNAETKEITLSMTVEAVEDLNGTWVVASTVAAGDRIIIGATVNNVTKTMGAQNTSNRAAVTSGLSEGVLTPADGTKTLTLVDAGDNKFALRTLNGKYLSATSSSGNDLKEVTDYENDNNAKWTISINEQGVASVVAVGGNKTDLQYNSSNTIFSCYTTGNQKPINIYKIGTPDYGSYQRTVTPGNYGTICLPKAGTIEGATLFELAGKDENYIYIDETENKTTLVAGRPYIFLPTANEITVTYTSDETAPADTYNNLVGTFEPLSTVGVGSASALWNNYIIVNNKYIYVDAENCNLGANRAYIKSTIGAPQAAPAPGRRRVAIGGTNAPAVATGLGELNASEAPVKMVINGQLFILRGEKMYDVTGKLVK